MPIDLDLQALVDSTPEGHELTIDPGDYKVLSAVELSKSVAIRGAGCGVGIHNGVTLRFPPGPFGIDIGPMAPGSRIENVTIDRWLGTPSEPAVGPDVGIHLRATNTQINNVEVRYANQDGFYLDGTGGNNCNISTLNRCRVSSCGRHGLYAQGGDANQCLIIALDAFNNEGYGIFDSSFLGNHYLGCHTASNQLGGTLCDGTAQYGTLFGCYSEVLSIGC